MYQSLAWLAILELVGLAALPLAVRLFRSLPDAGYAFARPLGALFLTWLLWLAGTAAPIAGPPLTAWAVLLGAGALCWAWGVRSTLAAVRRCGRAVVAEEILFLAAFAVWTLMRSYVFHPGVGHTEQPMDLAFLQSALRSPSYPPYDPWMSGHVINYYYFGYLTYATLTKLSGVAAAVGFNLALSTIFALTLSGCFSIVYGLTGRIRPALLGPLFVGLLGNWHAVIAQLPNGQWPLAPSWFWSSTRVVGGVATINEFPYFSLMLGDLHPHVMTLPVTIMVIGIALALVLSPRLPRPAFSTAFIGPAAMLAVCIGSLYPSNAWDFPTYLSLTGAALLLNARLHGAERGWWRAPAVTAAILAAGSVLAFLPFYRQFHSPVHGFGLVTTPSPFGQVIQVFGLFLLAAALFGLGWWRPGLPVRRAAVPSRSRRPVLVEAGAISPRLALRASIATGAIVFAAVFGQWTFVLLAAGAAVALHFLRRGLRDGAPPADLFVFLLLAAGLGVLAVCEIVYFRDVFDHSLLYRMNTVFKFYYQGWTLLGLAGAYAAVRGRALLRRRFGRITGLAARLALIGGILMGAVYTLEAWRTAEWGGTATGLNGQSLLQERSPSDAAAVAWLQAHVRGNPVTLEAGNGADFDDRYTRVSSYTGLPTVMGWAGHEVQWRGDIPAIRQRVRDVDAIYGSASPARTEALLRKYHVDYVFVGTVERHVPHAQVRKFLRFMRPVYRRGATAIYTW